MAIVTGAIILLFLVIYYLSTIAAYQRKKSQLAYKQICDSLLMLEKEQARIALDLHDDIGNTLTSIKMQMEASKPMNDDDLNLLCNRIGKVIDKVREVTFNLMPEKLEKHGLLETLKKLVASSPVKVHISGPDVCLQKQIELQLFRIIQELLSNTIKHAKAKEVNIFFQQNDHSFTLRYRDNGNGFDREKVIDKGRGLSNIQARAILLNATFYLTTKPGEGASWQLEIPLQKTI